MKYKKFLFSLILIVFFIASVSAADVDANETQLDASDEVSAVPLEEVMTEELSAEPLEEEAIVNESLASSQEDAVGDADDGTFTALQSKIYNADEGATITLTRDYAYDEGFSNSGIEIDKNLTINGNGHTLNGKSQSRIFLVKLGVTHYNKVTLKNIKFVNGNSDLYGGAIFNYGDLTVSNCEFKNNYAKYCGGAINSIGYLECKNSKFTSNVAGGDGGAIFTLSLRGSFSALKEIVKNDILNGNLNFLSSISNNFSLVYKTELISKCSFTKNVAKGRGGGAVYAFGNINIKSSTFSSNKATAKGGAVFANRELYISNSKFTSNTASLYGGAVYFKCHANTGYFDSNNNWVTGVEYYKNLISGSVFKKNSATKGGAIYGFKAASNNKNQAKAVKCTFEANKASKGRDVYGGSTTKCVFNYLKLTLKTVKVKKSAKKLVLTAKLTKGKSLISGKKIVFKFNGKTYKAKTNKKGIAKVTVKKNVLKKLKVGKKVAYLAKYGKLTVKKSAKIKK